LGDTPFTRLKYFPKKDWDENPSDSLISRMVCSANTFDGIPSGIPVTVPMANVGDYRNATGWNRFSNYIGKY